MPSTPARRAVGPGRLREPRERAHARVARNVGAGTQRYRHDPDGREPAVAPRRGDCRPARAPAARSRASRRSGVPLAARSGFPAGRRPATPPRSAPRPRPPGTVSWGPRNASRGPIASSPQGGGGAKFSPLSRPVKTRPETARSASTRRSPSSPASSPMPNTATMTFSPGQLQVDVAGPRAARQPPRTRWRRCRARRSRAAADRRRTRPAGRRSARRARRGPRSP